MKDVPTKCCGGCQRLLPIDQFRRRKRGGEERMSNCNACHNEYMRAYRGRRRGRAISQFAQQAKWRTDLRYLDACCLRMMARFGGADRFAKAYVEHYQSLSGVPGSQREAVDLLLAALRFMDLTGRPR